MDISRREIYRYLGFGNVIADEETRFRVEQCVRQLEAVISPRFCARTFPLTELLDDELDFSFARTKSRDLSKNLSGCEKVIFFAATLGLETDRLLHRYEKVEMSRAVILQAVGTAFIEAYCDQENLRLKREWEEKGRYLRPRFSPGYGDFSLSFQTRLLGMLEAEKRVGITLTDSLLMIPSKSVTALIGVSRERSICASGGCEACGKTDCAYRQAKAGQTDENAMERKKRREGEHDGSFG